MVNLEEIETYIFNSIKNFLSDHPIASIKLITIFFIITLLAMSVIMMTSVIGLSQIDEHAKEEFKAGNITIEQYNTQMLAVTITNIFYYYIDILVKISVISLFVIIIYIAYKFLILPTRKP